MPTRPFYFIVRAPVHLGGGTSLHPGDIIRYDPSDHARPYTLHTVATLDPGAILEAMERAAIDPIDLRPSAISDADRAWMASSEPSPALRLLRSLPDRP